MSKNAFYIEKIGNKTAKYSKEGKKFMSVKEYEQCVKHVIYKNFRRWAALLLKNDEIVANLITAAAIADWRYDGRGSIEGYRVSCVKWAVKKTMVRLFDMQKMLYLSTRIGSTDNHEKTLLDAVKNIPIKKKTYYDVSGLLDWEVLTQKEKDRLRMYYVEGKTYQEIADIEGLSKWGIYKSINKTVEKIKECLLLGKKITEVDEEYEFSQTEQDW